MKKKVLLALCGAAMFAFTSCANTNDLIQKESNNIKLPQADEVKDHIEISGADKLEVGSKALFNLKLLASGGVFSWESSDPSVASVQDGYVSALKEGKTTIKVTSISDLSVSASKEITVVKDLDNKFNVSFYNYDGSLLYSTEVEEGASAIYQGVEPTRKNSATTIYKFLKWDKSLDNINENTDIKAVYQESDFGDFYFEFLGTSYKLTGYGGKDEVVEIPTTFNGKYVTGIGKDCFGKNNTTVKKIIIPEGINTIDNYAFEYLLELEEANVPASVYNMGDYIFSNCKKLNKVTLAEGVTKISNYMFSQCGALKEIAFPSTLTHIGTYAFFYCGFETIEIPESVTSFGDGAFNNNGSLTSAKVLSKAEYLGTTMFASCKKLVDVDLGTSVKTLGMYFFGSCSALKTIVIPDSVETIGERAFSETTSLESVTLGKNVKNFGETPFLKSKVLENPAEYIKLKGGDTLHILKDGNIYTDGGKTLALVLNGTAFSGALNFKEMGIENIGGYSFYDNDKITSIDLTGVKTIGESAFERADKISGKLYIPSSVTTLGNSCFENCESFTEVQIGDEKGSVEVIPERAFATISQSTKFTVFEGTKSLEYGAFAWQRNPSSIKLVEVYLPKSINHIAKFAFQYSSTVTIKYSGTAEEWSKIKIDEPIYEDVKIEYLGDQAKE